MLSYANLLLKHNENMEMRWKESEEILQQIELNIKSLQIKLDKIFKENCSEAEVDFGEFKLQLFQLKLLFQQLPQYHKLIIELVNNMINVAKD